MNENLKPVEKLTPFTKMIMTIGTLPSSFYASMSYYESMVWLYEYLKNTVIPTVNNNGEAVDELQQKFIEFTGDINEEVGDFKDYINGKVEELETYMNNYFENLDVQNEINNKLDAMALDGTLTNLISGYVDPIYGAYETRINGKLDDQDLEISNFKSSVNGQINEIDNKVESATSGTPKGVYSTVTALTTDDPDHDYIYLVTEDGKWYYYDTSTTTWTAGGTYITSLISNLYTDVLFGQNNSFEFDTTNHTVKINPCRFFYNQTLVDFTTAQTVNYPTTGTATCYLFYDTTDSTFKVNPMSTAPLSTYAIVMLFNRNNINNPKLVSYKGNYIVDNAWVNTQLINNFVEIVSINEPHPAFEFDTTANTVKIGSIRWSKLNNGTLINPTGTTIDYSSTTISTLAIAYDYNNSSYSVNTLQNFMNNDRYAIICMFNKNLTSNEAITYKGNIKINGKETQQKRLQLYIDSVNGNDLTGTGSSTYPFKTFAKAISLKPDELLINDGDYEVSSTNINWNIIIRGNFTSYNASTNTKFKKPTLIFGKKLAPTSDAQTGLLKVDYSSVSADIIYQVFVSQTLPIETTGSRPSYYVTLWLSDIDDETNDLKLIPKLSLAECQATDNSFYYDGTSIYINDATNYSSKRYVLSISDLVNNGIQLSHIESSISNIALRYAYNYNLYTSNSSNALFDNCEFGNSSSQDGISLNYSNSKLYNCKAYKNRNDGYNIHNFGSSTFINCEGYYNEDDGISHHDGTNAYIEGGEYHHNGKGGISSPTYGSNVNISNAYCHHNNYGLYAVAESLVDKPFIINNCLLKNNTSKDIYMNYYDAIGYNNIYDEKTVLNGTLTEY